MAATVAILKIFNCYLLSKGKSDWAEIWWKASGQHGNLELLRLFCSDPKMAATAANLKIFKPHLLSNAK